MANELLNPSIITKEAVMEFKNALVMLETVDQQHTSEFKSIGDTLLIRQPVYFTAIDG